MRFALRLRPGPLVAAALVLASAVAVPRPLAAQFTLRDFVVSAGAAAEGYQGNLPAVGVPVTDSTEVVSAITGELALRSEGDYQTASSGSFFFAFDGGVRQFAATGFEQADYSPREWVGTLDLGYAHQIAPGAALVAEARLRGREIQDRPPMPLYLQPGYRSGEASLTATLDGPGGVLYDFRLAASRSDFLAPAFAPQIRLLDREALLFEAGALIASGPSTLRLFVGLEGSRYPEQETFAPEDPYRRDRTFHGGATWTRQTSYLLQVALEARANRSNSLRPEYDAVTLSGLFTTSLPRDLALSVYGAVSAKSYLHPSEFARLLPGEEADNATLAYVAVSRALSSRLDGTVRVGWTRAETEVGDAYFQRFGGSFIVRFRPEL
jgi:hypothetical protein